MDNALLFANKTQFLGENSVSILEAVSTSVAVAEDVIERTPEFATAWLRYREESAGPHEIVLYPRLLQKLGIIKDQVIIDAGCGDGTFLRELLKHEPSHIIGFDINQSLINEASLRFGGRVELFQHDLASTLPLGKNICNKLVSSCVLMHLDNPEVIVAASEFARVVQPGGEVVVCVVHHQWASLMYDLQKDEDGVFRVCKCKNGVEFVEFYRSGDFFESVFRDVGFEIIGREDVNIPHNVQLPSRYSNKAGYPLFEIFHLSNKNR